VIPDCDRKNQLIQFYSTHEINGSRVDQKFVLTMRRTSQVRRKWIDFDMIIERVHKGLGEGLFHQIHLFNFAFLPDAQLVRCPNLRRTSEVRRRWIDKLTSILM